VLIAAGPQYGPADACGLVLKALFAQTHPALVALMAFVMLAAAGFEAMQRQKRRFCGPWGYGVGSFSMFVLSAVCCCWH